MSTTSRVRRIERIIALRERAAEEARGRVASKERDVESAEKAERIADAFWQSTLLVEASATHACVDDLVIARVHLDGLRKKREARAVEAESARAALVKERAARAVIERELRKVELWKESLLAAERRESERVERRENDEFAARVFREGAS